MLALVVAEKSPPCAAQTLVAPDELDRRISLYLASYQERAASQPAPGQASDPAQVEVGRVAFATDCAQCHDGSRALEKQKDLAGWRATVRRMAAKQGANIPASDWEAIATDLIGLRWVATF